MRNEGTLGPCVRNCAPPFRVIVPFQRSQVRPVQSFTLNNDPVKSLPNGFLGSSRLENPFQTGLGFQIRVQPLVLILPGQVLLVDRSYNPTLLVFPLQALPLSLGSLLLVIPPQVPSKLPSSERNVCVALCHWYCKCWG